MIQRSVIMSFEDPLGKKVNVSIRDIKETVKDTDISTLMDTIVTDGLMESTAGALTKKLEAEVITKETQKVTL